MATAFRPGVILSVGQSQYVNVPDNAVLDTGGEDFTIMCWVLMASGTSHNYKSGINTLWDKMTASSPIDGLALQYNLSTAELIFGYGTGGTSAVFFTTAALSPPLTGGGWRHVAVTWNGADVTIYVDGTSVLQTAEATAWIACTEPLTLGQDPGSTHYGGAFLDGVLGDTAVYMGTALSAAEIAAVAAGGSPPPGYTARWQFDETSGATATDSGPNGLTGTLENGATWLLQAPAVTVTARPGVLLNSAANQYITVADNPALDVTGPLTVMIWALLYPGDGGSPTQGYNGLIHKANGNLGWLIECLTTYPGYVNVFEVGIGIGTTLFGANTGGLSSYGITMTDGAWHHYALVWDGQNLLPYIDGTIPWGGQPNTTDWEASTTPLFLGVGVLGILADACVYNGTALTAAQVAAVAAGGEPPAGYTARWRLNETSGTVAHDSGPHGLNGTLINGASWSMPAPLA